MFQNNLSQGWQSKFLKPTYPYNTCKQKFLNLFSVPALLWENYFEIDVNCQKDSRFYLQNMFHEVLGQADDNPHAQHLHLHLTQGFLSYTLSLVDLCRSRLYLGLEFQFIVLCKTHFVSSKFTNSMFLCSRINFPRYHFDPKSRHLCTKYECFK